MGEHGLGGGLGLRRFRAPRLGEVDEVLALDERVSHHLLRVVGIAPGEKVELFDGQGRAALAELIGVQGGRARLRQLGDVAVARGPEVTLLLGACRHGPLDTSLRMATELGVASIVVFEAERGVVRGERAERWARLVESAAAQSGRADIPSVAAAPSLRLALAELEPGASRRVYLPRGPRRDPPSRPCVLLVGPEGGLSPAEVEAALDAGFVPEGLASPVLRVDTAVAVVLGRLL